MRGRNFNRVIQNRLKDWAMLTIDTNVAARAEDAKAKIAQAAKIAKLMQKQPKLRTKSAN